MRCLGQCASADAHGNRPLDSGKAPLRTVSWACLMVLAEAHLGFPSRTPSSSSFFGSIAFEELLLLLSSLSGVGLKYPGWAFLLFLVTGRITVNCRANVAPWPTSAWVGLQAGR